MFNKKCYGKVAQLIWHVYYDLSQDIYYCKSSHTT